MINENPKSYPGKLNEIILLCHILCNQSCNQVASCLFTEDTRTKVTKPSGMFVFYDVLFTCVGTLTRLMFSDSMYICIGIYSI